MTFWLFEIFCFKRIILQRHSFKSQVTGLESNTIVSRKPWHFLCLPKLEGLFCSIHCWQWVSVSETDKSSEASSSAQHIQFVTSYVDYTHTKSTGEQFFLSCTSSHPSYSWVIQTCLSLGLIYCLLYSASSFVASLIGITCPLKTLVSYIYPKVLIKSM